jgi:uncharacterized membrane protein
VSRPQRIGVYGFGVFFVVAGLNHFVMPDFYLKITPLYLPMHQAINVLVGFAEIALGVGVVFPATRRAAGWGSIMLLIAVFPANIYVFQNQHLLDASPAAHLIRLPLQAVFIGWVYWAALSRR